MRVAVRTFSSALMTVWVFCGPTVHTAAQSTSSIVQSNAAASTNKSSARDGLLSAIPAPLYAKWRKYGQWDYKEQGFGYRDFTLMNFGATGSAAHFDQESLMTLAKIFPTAEDIQALDDPSLPTNFRRDEDSLDKLRKMADSDAKVIRIAPDFTWLADNSKWPRDDVGFSNERWDEYRQFFKELSLSEGIVRTSDFPGAVFFVSQSNGLCTGGSSAGYVYSTSQLKPTSDSPSKVLDADARANPSRHYAYVFRPLKANWYAFYEIDW